VYIVSLRVCSFTFCAYVSLPTPNSPPLATGLPPLCNRARFRSTGGSLASRNDDYICTPARVRFDECRECVEANVNAERVRRMWCRWLDELGAVFGTRKTKQRFGVFVPFRRRVSVLRAPNVPDWPRRTVNLFPLMDGGGGMALITSPKRRVEYTARLFISYSVGLPPPPGHL